MGSSRTHSYVDPSKRWLFGTFWFLILYHICQSEQIGRPRSGISRIHTSTLVNQFVLLTTCWRTCPFIHDLRSNIKSAWPLHIWHVDWITLSRVTRWTKYWIECPCDSRHFDWPPVSLVTCLYCMRELMPPHGAGSFSTIWSKVKFDSHIATIPAMTLHYSWWYTRCTTPRYVDSCAKTV